MISNMNALLVNSRIINVVILSCCEDLCENFENEYQQRWNACNCCKKLGHLEYLQF